MLMLCYALHRNRLCPHLFRGISDSFDWQFMKTRKFMLTSCFKTCQESEIRYEQIQRGVEQINWNRTEQEIATVHHTSSRGASFCASLVTGSTTATTSKYTSPSFGRIFTALPKVSKLRSRFSACSAFKVFLLLIY